MPFILFTLIEETQKINPFNQAGAIHNAGLDYIIANIGTADVAQLATDYIAANYTTNLIYPNQTIDPISVKGFNVTVNPTDTLADIDLGGLYNEYIEKVFSYIDTFPPTQSENTLSQSYVIFNDDYGGQFNLDMDNLLDAILDSTLPNEQVDLAIIALSILNDSYTYWKNTYNDGGGGGGSWYSYITSVATSVNVINWRVIIKQGIKGALQGAIAANRNNLNNINGNLTICAATAGMAVSAQNVILQTGVVSSEWETAFEVLYSFDGVHGGNPNAGLINVENVLYGTASGGAYDNGVVFSINIDGTDFADMHDFDGTDGAYPSANIINIDNVLYSTAVEGGVTDQGVIFSINPDGTGFTDLHNFDGTLGELPENALLNVAGVLYGMASGGGAYSEGNIFSINPNGTSFTALHDFTVIQGSPNSNLINVNGILYGTTVNGGASDVGIIFNIFPDGTGFNDLHDFNSVDGDSPRGGLILVNNILFGTTSLGGLYSAGTIFCINIDGSGFTNLYNFDGATGANPSCGLIVVNGILYGTAMNGGTNDGGVIFSINPDGTGFTVLYNFDFAHGGIPSASLLNVNGVLYRTTQVGGSGYGVIFSLTMP